MRVASNGDEPSLHEPGRRIVMLVPHDPQDDPRIAWVASLCSDLARTDVIGAVWSTLRPTVEFDGVTAIQRRNIYEVSSVPARALATALGIGSVFGAAGRYLVREGRLPVGGAIQRADHHVGAVARFLSATSQGNLIVNTLARAGRASSVAPRVVVCHDIYALLAAPALKRRFGCSIIYDSHEFWPQADLIAQPWEEKLMTKIEGRAIRHADAVVTVSPPLADHLRRLYGLDTVVSVPNAEPFDDSITPSASRPADEPVRFLLQGQVAPGRGIEALLRNWAEMNMADAILELRCPDNPYLSLLRERFVRALDAGRIVLRPPVREDELVQAATAADVGVIPYVGPNLNHLYACPNKLSQYMQAGLAILSNNLVFVSAVVQRYQCGAIYEAASPESLRVAVRSLVDDRARLQQLKQNAREASRAEFNWAVQSAPYRALIISALEGRLGP